jgi:hypothetical protein
VHTSMTLGGSVVEQNNAPPPTPKDATKATEDQRELQEKLEHQDQDPDAPARSQSRHQIPDES